MEPKEAISHYDIFAEDYDRLSRENQWYSPEVLFGLLFEFIKKDDKLLDIGIGTGQSSIPFNKIGLQIYGIDGSKEMLKICKEKNITKDLKEFDLNKKSFPYGNNYFNHIISNGVLYFFKDLDNVFIEAKRMLKKDGTFSITIENLKEGYQGDYVNKDNDLISERIIQKVGVRVYRHSTEYIKDLIRKHGFELIKNLEYFAYHSPSESKDIFFKAYILRKKN